MLHILASAPQGGAGGAVHALVSLDSLVALTTLTALEIVLGIDNIVFLAILTGRLPERRQPAARRLGLLLAMGMRILLLLGIFWIMKLTAPLLTLPFAFLGEHEVNGEMVPGLAISGRDLILLLGGLFLIAKATYEIHEKLEAPGPDALHPGKSRAAASFAGVLLQVVLIDLVFSLDSVITAVGMAKRIEVMIAAVVIAVLVMMAFAGAISRCIERHPTLKMLALAFLVLIGVLLVADGLHRHMPRGYVYFAMAFALGVEMLNIRAFRGRRAGPAAGSGDPG
ncbi:MAG: TerC family protein [Phycisphaeraceae bacterium]|nr:TerC family protein [Phycisphaeraceae bacterium]MCB9847751.1 TerC family protein [Phycisphaeraceae bacterium]